MNDGSPIGFLGAGYIADWHAAALRDCPGRQARRRLRPGRRPCPGIRGAAWCDRVYTSLGEMLSEGRLDAIHVLLPPELHAQAAGEIIDAGLDVLLEKPMAIAVDECDSLIEQCPVGRGQGGCRS